MVVLLLVCSYPAFAWARRLGVGGVPAHGRNVVFSSLYAVRVACVDFDQSSGVCGKDKHRHPSVFGATMFTHLLIATDGSELAAKAESTGLKLAKQLGARVTAVTATEPWSAMTNGGTLAFDFPIAEYEKAAARHAAAILAKVDQAAAKLGVTCERAHVIDFAAEAIIETAKVKGCDLIVMASHGRRGVKQLLLGSQAQRVVSLSSLPVLVCR